MALIPTDANLVSPMGDFPLAVAIGAVKGWSFISTWHEASQVSNTQQEMSNIAGIRTLPPSAAVVSIVSSSAEDGAGTSTGALSILVKYLDSNLERQQEVVTLTGTTPATTVGTALRLEQCLVTSVGSTGAAVGTITLSIGGNGQASISPTQNETRESGFTIPRGFRFLPSGVVITSSKGGKDISVDFAFEYRLEGSDVWYTLRSLEILNGIFVNDVTGTVLIPAGTDFRILAKASATNGPEGYVNFRGYLIDEATKGI